MRAWATGDTCDHDHLAGICRTHWCWVCEENHCPKEAGTTTDDEGTTK